MSDWNEKTRDEFERVCNAVQFDVPLPPHFSVERQNQLDALRAAENEIERLRERNAEVNDRAIRCGVRAVFGASIAYLAAVAIEAIR